MNTTTILLNMLIWESTETVETKVDKRMRGVMRSENEEYLSKNSRDIGWVENTWPALPCVLFQREG